MRYFFYKFGLWIRDNRRSGYTRPIAVTVAITAVVIAAYKFLETLLFPGMSRGASLVTAILLSSALAGAMAYVALRLYRQMAQETIDELTERLRLSEELLGERNLIKSLMETAVDRIFFKDRDGRYIRASASVAAGFHLASPADIAGRSDVEFYAESYARQLREDEQEVMRTGEPIVGRSYREVHRDGRETWASITLVALRDRHDHVIGTLGIARDITESRRREQRFRQLSRAVEQSPNMVLITDRSGIVEYVNPTFTLVAGFNPDEIIGRSPRLLNSGRNDPHVFQQLWETLLRGQQWRGELLNRRKNGQLYWARSTISPIRDPSGEITHFVAITEDVTLEKQAAAALEAESARRKELERIITISPAVAFLWRAEEGWPVEYVSENVRRWGYTAEQMVSGQTSFSSIVHKDDLPRVAAEVGAHVAAGRDEFRQEYRIVTASGETAWVEDETWVRRGTDGRVTHFQGVCMDVTERRRAQLALVDAENAQRALTDGLRRVLQIADELIACPTEDALYLRAVELARERLGLERCGIVIRRGEFIEGTYGTDLAGQTTVEHDLRFPIDDVWRERLRVRTPGEARWTIVEEPYRVWIDGKAEPRGVGWVGITPIQSSSQGPIGVFSNDTAISGAAADCIRQEVLAVYCSLLGNMIARKRAEDEQAVAERRQREFMERTDRLNSLGLLAAGLAHEINNPLQGMLSHLHAVQRSVPPKTPAQTSLDMVERGIDAIAMLVRKLLSLGTAEQGLEMADARESLEFVSQLLESQFRRARVRIVREPGDAVVPLAMPRRELIQVLLNLIINARDAMAQGGTITVSAAIEGTRGIVTIADTGPGIPPNIIGQIFTPFFTTKGTKGTGLGLSVAESLVRGSGGTIDVKSESGKGTCFTLRIPLARKETA